MVDVDVKTPEQSKLDYLIDSYEKCRVVASSAMTTDYRAARKALDQAEHRLAIALLKLKAGYLHGDRVYAVDRTTGELWRRPGPRTAAVYRR